MRRQEPGSGRQRFGDRIACQASSHRAADNPLRIAVTLQPFDVSDMPIQPFLRTPDNYPKQEAARAGSARFPANSVAYLVVARFVDDVLVLPSKESFTGATDTMQFVGNFSKQIPYCLAYEDRNGAKPYAMFFRPGAKGSGSVQLFPAKTGTLFCDRTSTEVAPWTLVEANDKRFARIKVLRTLNQAIEAAFDKD